MRQLTLRYCLLMCYFMHCETTKTTQSNRNVLKAPNVLDCCPHVERNTPSLPTYLDPSHEVGNSARYSRQKPKLAIKDFFHTALEGPTARHVCRESFSLRRGALNNIRLCFVINGCIHADYRA